MVRTRSWSSSAPAAANKTPEPRLPGLIHRAPTRQDLEVQFLEHPRVRLLERVELPFCEDVVHAVHAGQRGPRGLFVIEQRVVEIEEDRPRGVSSPHMSIIETVGRGCMVN